MITKITALAFAAVMSVIPVCSYGEESGSVVQDGNSNTNCRSYKKIEGCLLDFKINESALLCTVDIKSAKYYYALRFRAVIFPSYTMARLIDSNGVEYLSKDVLIGGASKQMILSVPAGVVYKSSFVFCNIDNIGDIIPFLEIYVRSYEQDAILSLGDLGSIEFRNVKITK